MIERGALTSASRGTATTSELELVQRAFENGKKAAIRDRGGAISREAAHEAGQEAAGAERIRFVVNVSLPTGGLLERHPNDPQLADGERISETKMKTCVHCETLKTSAEFPPNPKLKDGLHSWCRVCMAAACRRWREKNAHRVEAYNEARRAR